MGTSKLRSLFKKKEKKEKPKKKPPQPKPKVESKAEDTRTLVKTGFAKRGTLIATLTPAERGRDGKNVLGETIPAKPVKEPRIVAGKNIKVEKGKHFYMNVDGIVELLKDEKDTFFIRGKYYIDGRFKLDISDDEMKAFLTVIPPIGGAKSVELEKVVEECSKEGIVFGLQKERIREAIERAEQERTTMNEVLIAVGEEVIDGKDGKLEYKVRLASGERFRIKEDGSVDFKEQDLLTTVEKEQLIAVVIKAQEGVKDGHTIKGEVIAARRGRDVEIAAGRSVRKEEKGDTLHYLSEIDGELFAKEREISVEPLMIIKGNVGPETGNIHFNGIVYIKGDIEDGYSVSANKSVTVKGNVGSALVKSNESIIIQNGVVGKHKGRVFAKGDISVKFAENANLQAVGSIYIQRAALNCKIAAGHKIVSKKEKGQIVGGELKAKKGIEVKVLGNESEHKMEVFLGVDFMLENRAKEIDLRLRQYRTALKKIVLLLAKLQKVVEDPSDLPDNLKKVYLEARKRRTVLKLAIDEMTKKEYGNLLNLDDVIGSEIVVHESLFRGTQIYFGNAFYEPDVTKTNVRLFYDKTLDGVKIRKMRESMAQTL